MFGGRLPSRLLHHHCSDLGAATILPFARAAELLTPLCPYPVLRPGYTRPPAAAVAAYGCLKALNTLLDAVAEMKHLLPTLEEITFPIMSKCISSDGQDVLEDVLQLLAYFTYFGGESGWEGDKKVTQWSDATSFHPSRMPPR
jgi:hypothetical protein